jgi:hypothetical protein
LQITFDELSLQDAIYIRYVQTHTRKPPSTSSPCPGGGGGSNVNWSAPTLADPLDLNLPEQQINDPDCEREIAEGGHCLVFLCGDKTVVPHQLGFQRITPDLLRHPPVFRTPEKVIEFHGHVIGLTMSPDEDEIYVNVRSWPENALAKMDHAPPIASQIEMHVIDMNTLEAKGKVSV